MTYLLCLIGRIPATFWGVIVGSFFSLGGVILSNWANDQRLRAQFENERALRNRERELNLKKEVYLDASEAITTGIDALIRFSDLELSTRNVTEPYSEKYPCIAKVHLIAQEESINAVVELTDALGAAFIRLAVNRNMILAQRQEMDSLKNQIDSFERERNRMLELIKQFNLTGETDSRKWEVLNQNFDFEQKRLTESSEKQNKLALNLYNTSIQFLKECISERATVIQLLAPALVAIRAEMELPLDEARYKQMTENSSQRLLESINSMSERLGL